MLKREAVFWYLAFALLCAAIIYLSHEKETACTEKGGVWFGYEMKCVTKDDFGGDK